MVYSGDLRLRDTRYPEAVALRTIDANAIAEELLSFFARVGVPEEILTDQGTNFTSQLLKEVYSLLQIKPIRTTPYHPQTDGLVERFNGTLKAMLKKTAVEEGKDWDRLLPYLLFAYREVPQASTGFSPFELVYGRNVRGPIDVLKESWEASTRSPESVVSYVMMVQERLQKLRDIVHENLQDAQNTQKQWYDRNARHREFRPGNQVLILLPTSSNKLLAEWRGPYQVVRKISDVNYEVRLTDGRKRNRIFHINMLREWHSPSAASFLAEEITEECEKSFKILKNKLCTEPILRNPDFSEEFILQTDASERGIGAVLSQYDQEGTEHPVAFYSRKLLPREGRYSKIEKECLAIKAATHHFRVYLLGRKFTIQTDHRALEWLDRLKDNNARLTRWSLALQPYHFVVRYRAGTANNNADGLSRTFADDPTTSSPEKEGGV